MYGLFILAGVAGYFSAKSMEKKYGRRLWNWPHWAWALLAAGFLLIAAILMFVAERQLKRELASSAHPVPSVPGGVATASGWAPLPAQPLGSSLGVAQPVLGAVPAQAVPVPVVAPAAQVAAPAAQVAAPAPAVPSGWYPDPSGRHQHRWWDGSRWSNNVATNGQQSVDV